MRRCDVMRMGCLVFLKQGSFCLNTFRHATNLQQTTLNIYMGKVITKIAIKRESVHYEQFLLLSKYFQKSSEADGSKSVFKC